MDKDESKCVLFNCGIVALILLMFNSAITNKSRFDLCLSAVDLPQLPDHQHQSNVYGNGGNIQPPKGIFLHLIFYFISLFLNCWRASTLASIGLTVPWPTTCPNNVTYALQKPTLVRLSLPLVGSDPRTSVNVPLAPPSFNREP